jgi:LruC domain-containing protein
MPYITPPSITVTVNLATPQTLAAVGLPPYNPFIIINKERGKEVHLPGYSPTSLVNPVYFGTEDDDSNPEIGKYYKSVSGLPWGMHLPVSFDYPIEKTPILEGHLVFDTWVLSGGFSYMDWYQDKPGYRETTFLYQH